MEEEIRACLDRKQYPEAFDLLLPAFQNRVFRLACSMLGDNARAEDTAQDVFVRIWKALPGYRGQSSLSTWIYAITRNACLTAIQAGAAHREISMEEPGVLNAAEIRGAVHATHASIDLDPLIGRLPEKHRQVLRLHYMERKSYEQVAEMLGLPMGTVKTYLHRGRKELAEALARDKMERRTS